MEPKIYKDFFNQALTLGDYVVVGDGYKYFSCCEVIKFTPKMVRVKDIHNNKEKLYYSYATMKVDSGLVVVHMLTRNK